MADAAMMKLTQQKHRLSFRRSKQQSRRSTEVFSSMGRNKRLLRELLDRRLLIITTHSNRRIISPQPLNRLEIYRQTQNQMRQLRGGERVKMFALSVENDVGEKLQLTNNRNYITKIEGLTPATANIATSVLSGMDGSKLNRANIPNRNIVLTIYPQIPIEENRIFLYRWFMPGKRNYNILCKWRTSCTH